VLPLTYFLKISTGLDIISNLMYKCRHSVQLELESGTICRETSDSRTCHTSVSDGRWRLKTFLFGQSDQSAVWTHSFKEPFRNILIYLLTLMMDYLCQHTKESIKITDRKRVGRCHL